MHSSPLADQLSAALGGAYTIERELGGGGMAHVFVALDEALQRRVAVKVLPPNTRLGANGNAFVGGFRLWDPDAPGRIVA